MVKEITDAVNVATVPCLGLLLGGVAVPDFITPNARVPALSRCKEMIGGLGSLYAQN